MGVKQQCPLPGFPELCRYLAELSPQPMVAVEGLTHVVRYANPAFRKLVGKEAQNLFGRTFGEAVPEGMANGCAPLLDRVFESGTAEALPEQEHRHSGGGSRAGAEDLDRPDRPSTHWSYLAWAILLPVQDDQVSNGNEKPVGVMIQVTDATEVASFRTSASAINEALLLSGVRQHELMEALRESEAKEREARMEAEAANRSKDLFIATLSHELRTPVNTIMGWAAILLEESPSAEDLQEGLRVIERSIKSQEKLIEDMLDVTRIVSGKLRLDMGTCDLAAVMRDALNAVRPAASAKEIELSADLDPAAAVGAYDAARMRQVVSNLLTNALKFTPAKGKVGVRLWRERVDVKLQITDSGAGMSPDFLPYVFDRFRQADSGTRRKVSGLGLGLSIAKNIVEMHGGTIEAHSDGEGMGSTFTVTLPQRAIRMEAYIEPDTETDFREQQIGELIRTVVRLDGLRILAVDDHEDARRLLQKVLQEAGAMVTVAASTAEALVLLKKVNPHVLVSDLAMPDQDGYDLIRQVRNAGHTARDLPAIALTALAGKQNAREALLARFQVHVSKPVDPYDLIIAIHGLAGTPKNNEE